MSFKSNQFITAIIWTSQIKKYILSDNYWANYVAIFALCSTLKLNIIPIFPQNGFVLKQDQEENKKMELELKKR